MEQLIQAAAPVVLVIMGIGIMFGLVRPRSVIFFLLCLLFLPFLFSAVTGTFRSIFSAEASWKVWLIGIGVGLIALRLLLNRLFRR